MGYGIQRSAFKKWIDKIGPYRVAELVGVRSCTVFYWRSGKNYPRLDQMRKIRVISKGAVSYEQMIDRLPA